MGGDCEICRSKKPDDPKVDIDRHNNEVVNRNFSNFIFQDRFIDFVGDRYKLDDPIFKLFHKEERDILEKFYKSNKNEFQNNMETYLKNQNLNFVNALTKQIISIEGGRKKMNEKIKDEIDNIKMYRKLFKLDYLTVMITGITGVGKSCLVNNLLYDGKEIEKKMLVILGQQNQLHMIVKLFNI